MPNSFFIKLCYKLDKFLVKSRSWMPQVNNVRGGEECNCWSWLTNIYSFEDWLVAFCNSTARVATQITNKPLKKERTRIRIVALKFQISCCKRLFLGIFKIVMFIYNYLVALALKRKWDIFPLHFSCVHMSWFYLSLLHAPAISPCQMSPCVNYTWYFYCTQHVPASLPLMYVRKALEIKS